MNGGQKPGAPDLSKQIGQGANAYDTATSNAGQVFNIARGYADNAHKTLSDVTGGQSDAMRRLFDSSGKNLDDFGGTFLPLLNKQADDAADFASPDNIASARGRAVADVTAANESQMRNARARLAASGVDPNSIQGQALDAQARVQTAANAAGAATQAALAREAQGAQMVDQANQRGLQLGQLGQQGTTAGSNIGSQIVSGQNQTDQTAVSNLVAPSQYLNTAIGATNASTQAAGTQAAATNQAAAIGNQATQYKNSQIQDIAGALWGQYGDDLTGYLKGVFGIDTLAGGASNTSGGSIASGLRNWLTGGGAVAAGFSAADITALSQSTDAELIKTLTGGGAQVDAAGNVVNAAKGGIPSAAGPGGSAANAGNGGIPSQGSGQQGWHGITSGSLSNGLGMDDATGVAGAAMSLGKKEGKLAGTASGAAAGYQLGGPWGALIGAGVGYISEGGAADAKKGPLEHAGFTGDTMEDAWRDENLLRLGSNPAAALASKLGVKSNSTLGKILDPSSAFKKHGDEKRNWNAFDKTFPGTTVNKDGNYVLPQQFGGAVVTQKQLDELSGTWYGATAAPDGDQAGWQQKFESALNSIILPQMQGQTQQGLKKPDYTIQPLQGGIPAMMSQGGPVRGYSEGGEVSPQGALPTPPVPGSTDTVPAFLTPDEFVIPRDVATWKGHEYWHKEIGKTREKMQQHQTGAIPSRGA